MFIDRLEIHNDKKIQHTWHIHTTFMLTCINAQTYGKKM